MTIPTSLTIRKAQKEIKEVLRRHDLAGIYALADGDGSVELLAELSPSWSLLMLGPGSKPGATAVGLRIPGPDEPDGHRKGTQTFAMVECMHLATANAKGLVESIVRNLNKHAKAWRSR